MLEKENRMGPGFVPRPPAMQYQDELYRCCYPFSAVYVVTFPEFEATKGYANFHVPSRKWGTVGDQLDERIGHLSQHGIYHPTYELDDFVILDFRTAELGYEPVNLANLHSHSVVFQEGSRYVVVMDNKKQTVENGEFMLLDDVCGLRHLNVRATRRS
ncbi:hypothetical protein BDN72DRAFT_114725 [Pluteus cervinus]|uniref:Uncharacterized protein n=1 Tax=Pluteus cervinus TaxID=181527 RepID=A0ACD3AMF1_9AGAR|nr:hypothetical protein BDN72DRAFT_114725 [Pluteus cervinus]